MTTKILYLSEKSFADDALRWAWALGAVYNVYHGFPVDLPVDPEVAARGYRVALDEARQYLRNEWEITDRAALVSALVALGREGHRRSHRALVRRLSTLPSQPWSQYESADRDRAKTGDAEAARRLWRMWAVHKDLMGCRTAPFLGFDAARAAMVARCGFALGWLDEAELRGYLFDLAREVAATYGSWAEYGRDFEAGRAFWAGAREDQPWPAILASLASDPRSPWVRLPFVFPETDGTRGITSLDTVDGPFWTLETVDLAPPPLAVA